MRVSRRIFIRDGVATVTLGLSAPAFLSAIAQAQGLPSRRLVVVYLGGGNDALNTLVSYQDPAYYNRRPSIAIPAGQVLQVGADAAGRALGLHPRLGGLLNIFNEGHLALVQRTGYANSSRSHFEAGDIWGTANPESYTGSGAPFGNNRCARNSERQHVHLCEPEPRFSGLGRARCGANHGVEPGTRQAAPRLREQHEPRGDRNA